MNDVDVTNPKSLPCTMCDFVPYAQWFLDDDEHSGGTVYVAVQMAIHAFLDNQSKEYVKKGIDAFNVLDSKGLTCPEFMLAGVMYTHTLMEHVEGNLGRNSGGDYGYYALQTLNRLKKLKDDIHEDMLSLDKEEK